MLEDIWPHLCHEAQDPVLELLDLQKTALDYQYQMIFKTIMNEASFVPELKLK